MGFVVWLSCFRGLGSSCDFQPATNEENVTNVGASIIRIGFWGRLYFNLNEGPQKIVGHDPIVRLCSVRQSFIFNLESSKALPGDNLLL